MATHGRSGINLWAMGSVAYKVLRSSKVPVCLIRAGITEETITGRAQGSKILVPLDGSESSLHALNKAIKIAKKFDGKITLINVYWISAFRITPSQLVDYVVHIRKAGEEILEKGKKLVKTEGVPVETVLKEGHNVEEILNTAKEGNYDLIVMGARGASKIKEILLGSTSYGVTSHAPCPVLIIK